MNTEENNNSEEPSNSEPIINEKQNKFKDKIIAFFKNNKAATVLSLLLLIVFVWFSVKLRINERNFIIEKTQLINQYEGTLDSLRIDHIKFATEVFSWSVRSELLRNNTENLNQLLTIFVQQSGADLVQIINAADNVVLLSSDKKFEGKPTLDNNLSNLIGTVVLTEENMVKIVSPIMGFNDKIGVLIVELNKK